MTNLKIVLAVLMTLAAYTLLANMIPQIQSEVPEQLELGDAVTPEALIAAGERIYNGAGGCTACHGLGTRAPNLLTSEAGLGPIGARCRDREAGASCKDYLYTSLTDPGAYVVEGYNPIMPDVSRTLGEDQVWALVAYLQAQGGEVTVSAQDIASADSPDSSEATPTPAGTPPVPATEDPGELLVELGCLTCHRVRGEGNPVGPSLDDVGARRDVAYIRESILDPAAQVSPGYESLAGMMPANFGDRVTAAQLEALVEFLAGLKGEGGSSP